MKVCDLLDKWLIDEWRQFYKLKRVWGPVIVGGLAQAWQYLPSVLPYVPPAVPAWLTWSVVIAIIAASMKRKNADGTT